MAAGCRWSVELDLEKFFDRVNLDLLMAQVEDKPVLRLIRRYLEAGLLHGGLVRGNSGHGYLCEDLQRKSWSVTSKFARAAGVISHSRTAARPMPSSVPSKWIFGATD